MSQNADDLKKTSLELGKYLSAIRGDRKLTLRQVEEATGKEVSNAYLSQLENGKVNPPSPHVLNTLAELYDVDYKKLMELAGHIKDASSKSNEERHGRVATFSDMNLTGKEEAELLKYLKFIRSEKE